MRASAPPSPKFLKSSLTWLISSFRCQLCRAYWLEEFPPETWKAEDEAAVPEILSPNTLKQILIPKSGTLGLSVGLRFLEGLITRLKVCG